MMSEPSTERREHFKGWTIEKRLWAIHWMVTVIWVTQIVSTLAVVLLIAAR